MTCRHRHSYSHIQETTLEDRVDLLDALEHWLEKVRAINHTIPILVEGFHDVEALRSLGLDGPILHLHKGGVSVYDRCKWISSHHPHVLLLLDSDPRGYHLRRKVIRFLESDWESMDELRSELFNLVGHYIQHVEALGRFYKKLYMSVHYSLHV